MAMLAVNVLTGSRTEFGATATFPVTKIIAIVSPIALPMPRTIAVIIPDRADGRIIFLMVCQCVAPRAKEPSL